AAAATSTGAVVHDGFGTDSTDQSTTVAKPNAAQAALDIGRSFGLSIIFAGLFAGFGLFM
ncbi:hypothetical protein V491_04242, partial [Pseudogymnoascus sp. VKM F-3775]